MGVYITHYKDSLLRVSIAIPNVVGVKTLAGPESARGCEFIFDWATRTHT